MKIGIVGYGNLGKQAEKAVNAAPDMQLVAVFTRRPNGISLQTDAKVESIDNILDYKGKIDVMMLCGGSATDIPVQMPLIAPHFCFVDCFDNHSQIPNHFLKADELLKSGGNVGAIAVGWDPGLFSVLRTYGEAILPGCKQYTFWGRGVSQGHSDAIRRIQGVKLGVQYTQPVESALQSALNGDNKEFTAREKHTRHCFVVAEKSANKEAIRQEIVSMPAYFADYDTTVEFVSEDEFLKNHTAMPHGGMVITSGSSADSAKHIIQFSLKLDSNPSFTASVQTAYARAVYRLKRENVIGCKTVLDIPPAYLSPRSSAELYKEFL